MDVANAVVPNKCLASLAFPCLPTIGAVVPDGVYRAITVGTVRGIIGFLSLLKRQATDKAKFYRMVRK